jgi:hypothetical protein
MTLEGLLRASQVDSSIMALRYAAQEIGCPIPIGHKARGALLRRILDEMEVQRWEWTHLTAAIDYMKSRGIRPRSFAYVFYHVEPAVHEGFMPRPAISSHEGLNDAVARAVYIETDEGWARRLSAARGNAKLKVYRLWEKERLPLLEGDE